MFVRPHAKAWSPVLAVSWRGVAQRFSFMFFAALAASLLVLGKIQPVLVDHMRTHTVDTLAPVLDAVSRPMTLASNAVREAEIYLALHEENRRLREDNLRLKDWENTAIALQKENQELQALLHFKVEPGLAYISARVIADTGGAFARGLVVTAGKLDGVREGMAAMTGDGLIGRVVEVGDWSSRIMLITDLNSRIPVTIASTNDRAILAGNNSSTPQLLYLPPDAVLGAGARVVTSGHGGVFPPNLPVGVVAGEPDRNVYSLTPAADLSRIDYVRLVDFHLNGGAFNPMAAEIDAETKSKKR